VETDIGGKGNDTLLVEMGIAQKYIDGVNRFGFDLLF
jgi:hypothetical protein